MYLGHRRAMIPITEGRSSNSLLHFAIFDDPTKLLFPLLLVLKNVQPFLLEASIERFLVQFLCLPKIH